VAGVAIAELVAPDLVSRLEIEGRNDVVSAALKRSDEALAIDGYDRVARAQLTLPDYRETRRLTR